MFFDNHKPHVTREEFREVMSALAGKEFTQIQRDRIRAIFHGDMEEQDWQHGIDQQEVERGIKWLRENKSTFNISDAKIDTLEQELLEKI